ncbi:low-density lipoprotein receptor-related protein 2-like [Acanthaster planci]|uniref:Low-density lipoprotein receptor-related protein 2-like n=1 Tax=Acanthaster planci TaxID=133434 RepID=A0A8B7Z0U0_ACAPL|nr:low-density lipoprotein receptor-related protein 2-like [Acanthaster planci]
MAGPLFSGSWVPFVTRLLLLITCMYSAASQSCDFVCGGVCLTQLHVCDGYVDCVDGTASDERNCLVQTECQLDFEKCPTTSAGTNNACIHPQWRCDGDNDCGDFSDENRTFCQTTPCPSSMVKCSDTFRCLPGYAYCNGVENCYDGSDEPEECNNPDYTCPTDHFKCLNSRRCIPNVWICDTEDDCGDNSDEREDLHSCSTHACDSTRYFTCQRNRPGHSRCIPLDLLCDGTSHCEYAEDENITMCGTPEPCQFYEFTCDNNLCIPLWYQCDHDNDCGDGSDEGNTCIYPSCSTFQFTCNNGRCISISNQCDGFDHCRDNSDEENCECLEGQFQCFNKQCIDASSVCNGINDCVDSSDEGSSCNVNECLTTTCQYACVDEPLSYHCTCPDGYVLDTDQHSCVDRNECIETPWVCDQICINNAGGYTCSCAQGYTLSVDGYNCTLNSGIKPYLIFANRYYIRRLGVEVNSTDYQRLEQDFDLTVCLDYDYTGGKLYFSDVLTDSILKMDINGGNVETVLNHSVYGVEGLAVDWVTKKLYWTDHISDLMEVSELDGSNRLSIIRSGLFEPRGLALDPEHGYAYWADWGLRPYIGRVGMDGSSKMELHDERVGWPNGLSIDYPSGLIYWVDAHLDYVAYSDLNFERIHPLLHDDIRHTIAHPFSISVFNKDIYFTDWNLKKIFKANKYSGDEVELKSTVHRPFDIKVVHPLRQIPLNNICQSSPCQGLCLISPGGTSYTCACAENYVLSGVDCIPLCPEGQLACTREHKCIPWYMQCNGVNDCQSGEDEVNCPPRTCQPGQYQCQDGNCLTSILWLCDGDRDCPDNSDEGTVARCNTTACAAWQFKCRGTGRCISRRYNCDKISQCTDGSDEDDSLCRVHECSEGYFQCDNGFCIPEAWKCDLDDDCGDGSDEPHRECQNTPCPAGWFSCQTNYRCIPEYARCNTYDECRDNSDEVGCEAVTCDPLGEYRCDNHRCIPQRWVCDLDNDCGDFSDERPGCTPRLCSESEFRCVSRGLCIRDRWVCDGNPDCSDGSDESSCGAIICRPDQFKCTVGGCIAANLTCNGLYDCGDRSDELSCDCTTDQFRCDNTLCLPNSQLCDTYDDCGDGSDETPHACQIATCEPSTLVCIVDGLPKCLPEHKRCDGIQDCLANEDEAACDVVCSADTFKCQNGQCISWDRVCNLQSDCSDNSDETSCYKDTVECEASTCQKECITLSPTSIVCSCGRGFVETADGCEDIDECYLNNPCPQVCRNTKGSYECYCARGFVDRGIHGMDCKAEGDIEVILFGDGSELRKYVLEQNVYQDLVVNEARIESLDFDNHSGMVYFADTELRAIKRVPFTNDGAMEAPDNLGLDNVYAPVGITIDWLGNNVYFTDQGLPDAPRGRRAAADRGPKVAVAALKSHPYHEKTLHVATMPRAIAVNPRRGLMYWTDLGAPERGSRLFMSWMNGENKIPVQAATGKLDQPTGLSVDYAGNDTVFWCDARSDKIGFITYDGSHFVILQTSGSLNNPFQLDVFGNLIYWTTRWTDQRGMIRTMNKTGGEQAPFLSGLNLPTAVKVWQQHRYPLDVPNPCERNPCLYLCLVVPRQKGNAITKGFECACPSGVPVDPRHCEGSPVVPTATIPATSAVPVCLCLNGGYCKPDGSCQCPDNYEGKICATPSEHGGGPPNQNSSIGLVVGLVAFIFIAIIVIVILLFVFLKKRRKFAGPVTYRDGQNVDIHAPPPGREVEPPNHYETSLAPHAPVTFENPHYAHVAGAAGGGTVTLPQKTALPFDPSLYQPGYQAEALPEKAYLQDGSPALQAHYPEPPPAYSPNTPPPPSSEGNKEPDQEA